MGHKIGEKKPVCARETKYKSKAKDDHRPLSKNARSTQFDVQEQSILPRAAYEHQQEELPPAYESHSKEQSLEQRDAWIREVSLEAASCRSRSRDKRERGLKNTQGILIA